MPPNNVVLYELLLLNSLFEVCYYDLACQAYNGRVLVTSS